MRYRFGDHVLCTATRRLTTDGATVHVEPQVFDVLVHLVEHRDRVVPKEELLDAVWGSRFVSESALTSRIKAARAAVGDDGRAQAVIRTAHGTGYRFVATADEVDSAPPTTGRRDRLPATVGTLHGRARELSELADLVEDHRLVTLLGPGGMGKTRLAIELGHELAGAGADRDGGDRVDAVFVDLAAVRDDEALGDALAYAIGVEAGAATDVVSACTAYLDGRRSFLIIDNCEHVADAATRLVERLLDEVPDVRLLATSRVPLDLPEERIFRLAPLPLLVIGDDEPSPELAEQNAAVALFCDRARRVRHDFELATTDVASVVTLCAALDGMPLAIELAAGRLGTFGIADLVDRLDRRLDLLGRRRTTGDDRHRTLRATLNWSYELLPPACRRLFRFLSVYPAGLSVDGVEWLADRIDLDEDPLLVLDGLAESCLVHRQETASGTRFPMLETMRAFGIDLLATSDELDWASRLAAERALETTATMRRERLTRERWWNDRIRRELPNLRTARSTLMRVGDRNGLLDLAVNLHGWGQLRNVSELWTWCDDIDPDWYEGSGRARAEIVKSQAAWRRGRIEEAETRVLAALETADDDWSRAAGHSVLATVRLFQRDLAAAAHHWQASTAIDGARFEAANVLLAHAYAGESESARAEMDELAAAMLASDHDIETAWAGYVLGEIAAVRGDPDCIEWLTLAVDVADDIGAHFVAGVAGLTLCTAMDAAGDRVGAAHRCSELVDHWLRSGGWTQLWTTLRNASIFLCDHDPTLALVLLTASDDDPDASEVDDDTAALTESYKASLAERADPERVTELLALGRSRLADTARRVLAEVP